MSETLELYEGIETSPEVTAYLTENKRAFERHDDWQKNHNGNYTYGVDSGFVDANRPDSFENPERLLMRKVARETLHQAIAVLSENQRSRLIKRFWQNRSYRDIAKEEGVDARAVENSINRALKNLRRELYGAGISAGDFAKPAEPVEYVSNTKRTRRRQEERKFKQREQEVMRAEPEASGKPVPPAEDGQD